MRFGAGWFGMASRTGRLESGAVLLTFKMPDSAHQRGRRLVLRRCWNLDSHSSPSVIARQALSLVRRTWGDGKAQCNHKYQVDRLGNLP